jgi:hypothetical protein
MVSHYQPDARTREWNEERPLVLVLPMQDENPVLLACMESTVLLESMGNRVGATVARWTLALRGLVSSWDHHDGPLLRNNGFAFGMNCA